MPWSERKLIRSRILHLTLHVVLTAMVNKVEQDRSEDSPEATFTFGIGRYFSHGMRNHASGRDP